MTDTELRVQIRNVVVQVEEGDIENRAHLAVVLHAVAEKHSCTLREYWDKKPDPEPDPEKEEDMRAKHAELNKELEEALPRGPRLPFDEPVNELASVLSKRLSDEHDSFDAAALLIALCRALNQSLSGGVPPRKCGRPVDRYIPESLKVIKSYQDPPNGHRYWIMRSQGRAPWISSEDDASTRGSSPPDHSTKYRIPLFQDIRITKTENRFFRLRPACLDNRDARRFWSSAPDSTKGRRPWAAIWSPPREAFPESTPCDRPAPATPGAGTYKLFRMKEPDYKKELLDGGIKDFVRRCRLDDVRLLLLPEFCGSEDLMVAFKKAARDFMNESMEALEKAGTEGAMGHGALSGVEPPVVVAGSRHTEMTKKNRCVFVNRTVVLGPSGSPLRLVLGQLSDDEPPKREWHQDKMWHFCLKKGDLNPEMIEKHGVGEDDHGIAEPESLGEELLLVDTPMGVISIGICIDLLHEMDRIPSPYCPPLFDIVFVPAATPTTARFENTARSLAEQGTACVVANACGVVEKFGTWPKSASAIARVPENRDDCDDGWQLRPANSDATKDQIHRTLDPSYPEGHPTMPPPYMRNGGEGKCTDECARGCLWFLMPPPDRKDDQAQAPGGTTS